MNKLTVETVNEERLRKAVDAEVFENGRYLFQQGLVRISEIRESLARCIVQDKHPYSVEIRATQKFLYLKCDCRFAVQGVICQHEIAACLAVRGSLQQKLPPRWRAQIERVIGLERLSTRISPKRPYLLFFELRPSNNSIYPSWNIFPNIFPEKAIPKESLPPSWENSGETLGHLSVLHKDLSIHVRFPYRLLDPTQCVNCPAEAVLLANALIERTHSYGYLLSMVSIDDCLSIIRNTNSPIFYGSEAQPFASLLKILRDDGIASLYLQRDSEGIHIYPRFEVGNHEIEFSTGSTSKSSPLNLQILSDEPAWMLYEPYIFKLTRPGNIELIKTFQDMKEITIPSKDEAEFQIFQYPRLAETLPLKGEFVSWELLETNPIPRVYLSDEDGSIRAELRFAYGDFEFSYDPALPDKSIQSQAESWKLVRIQRQSEIEKQVLQTLSSDHYGLKRGPAMFPAGMLLLRARIHPLEFLHSKVPLLIHDGFEVFGEERLQTGRVNRNYPRLSFIISSGIDWFDVKTVVSFGDVEVSWQEFRRAIRKRDRYIKLSDGTIGEIPEEWLNQYGGLFNFGKETSDAIRFAPHHLALLEHLIADSGEVHGDADFETRRARLRDTSSVSPVPLPASFVGELRPYQKAGYDWIHFLHEFNFGGCLADDMGLGKTIQVLAFLQSIKEKIGAEHHRHTENGYLPASLVVVPRSLLVNWQREASRFAPDLRILEYFEGTRSKDVTLLDETDIVITTYGVMLRDIIQLRKYIFHYVILDESQAVKNPFSQTARAARLLQSRHRLVMTGTPVENSTIELWSQFAFLNPDLLGGMDYFKENFILPIEKQGNQEKVNLLRKMVQPFILRRTKDQVAPELPPRSERMLFCDMEPAQEKFYQRTRDYYRSLLLGMIDSEGMETVRMRILEGLLRLRQISNHPSLVDEKFHGHSGKLDLLLETLDTLRSEGHKTLIFSQFVQMLRLVRRPLDDSNTPYAYLDGHTRNRQEQIDNFQNRPDIPFFLISLKAGGLGINLTAADYVIHIDPWWNPSVESQATDRTHRIGQERPVFIYKLITRDTVEEKILQLQERKKRLVDQLITTEGSFFKSIGKEDIEALFS